MKLAGLFLLPAGWAIVLTAIVLLPPVTIRSGFVLAGVAIEAVCTILLFGFDEGVSGAQQSIILKQQSQILAALSELCSQDNSLIGNPACTEFWKQRNEQTAKEKAAKPPK